MAKGEDHEGELRPLLTSHAGSLPRPDGLIAAWGVNDEQALTQKLIDAVAEVVRRQKELGIDVPGDGEFGKLMAQQVNYGSWWRYSWNRLGGLDPNGPSLYEMEPRRSRPGHVVLTALAIAATAPALPPPTTTPISGSPPGRGRRRRSASLHRICRPRRGQGRHSAFQGGIAGRRSRRRFHDGRRPGERLADRQCLLQD